MPPIKKKEPSKEKYSSEAWKNYVLLGAVDNGDIASVRKILGQGADPNYNSKYHPCVMRIAMKRKEIEIIKMLIKHGSNVDEPLMNHIFRSHKEESKEIVSLIINLSKTNEVLLIIFESLLSFYEEPESREVLLLLIDHGLSLQNHLPSGLTVLHECVKNSRADLVSILLERGADVNKKSLSGKTCLWFAVENDDAAMVKLLVKKGISVNEKMENGETVLHAACDDEEYSFGRKKMIKLLLRLGADVNALNSLEKTPLTYKFSVFSYFNPKYEKILVKKLAILRHENQHICPQNLEYLERVSVRQTWRDCLDELKRMKDCQLYDSLSLYDILKRCEQRKKLFITAKNANFETRFKECRSNTTLSYYGNDLDKTFEKAVKGRDLVQLEEKKLNSVLKDYLPELVINEVAYFIHEESIFESDSESEPNYESEYDSDESDTYGDDPPWMLEMTMDDYDENDLDFNNGLL